MEKSFTQSSNQNYPRPWQGCQKVLWSSKIQDTSKSLSEALIFVSTNPQYDNRLFIELQVQYMKILSLENVVYCTQIIFCFDMQNNLCTKHVLHRFCKNKSFWQRFTCNTKQYIPSEPLGFSKAFWVSQWINSQKQNKSMILNIMLLSWRRIWH